MNRKQLEAKATDVAHRIWVTSLALRYLGWDKDDLAYQIDEDGVAVMPLRNDLPPVGVMNGPVVPDLVVDITVKLANLESSLEFMEDYALILLWNRYGGDKVQKALAGTYSVS